LGCPEFVSTDDRQIRAAKMLGVAVKRPSTAVSRRL